VNHKQLDPTYRNEAYLENEAKSTISIRVAAPMEFGTGNFAGISTINISRSESNDSWKEGVNMEDFTIIDRSGQYFSL
jgi:hypothetical protein